MDKGTGTKKLLYVLGGLVTFCVALGLVVGLGTGIGPYDLPAKARELDKAIAKSKALGLPMTAAELAGPKPADGTNAAIEAVPLAASISEDMKAMGNDSNEDLDFHARSRKLTEELKGELDRFAIVVTSKPDWYVERDYDLGPHLLLPEYAEIKNVCKLLAWRAEDRAAKGDVDGALSDLRATSAVHQHLSQEPMLIGALVTIAIESTTLRTVERVASLWAKSPSSLAKLEDLLLSTQYRIDPVGSLKGEFYMGLNICRNLDAYGGLRAFGSGDEDIFIESKVDLSNLKRDGLPHDLFGKANLTTITTYWNTVFEKLAGQDQPARDWSADSERLSNDIQQRTRASEMVAKVIFPVFAQADAAMSRDDANQALALAFVRCMKFNAATGRFPQDLKEIQSEFDDPFDPGHPIKMKSSATELRVWSVGNDRKDDGALIGYAPRKPGDRDSHRSDDIVFVWPASLRTN